MIFNDTQFQTFSSKHRLSVKKEETTKSKRTRQRTDQDKLFDRTNFRNERSFRRTKLKPGSSTGDLLINHGVN